MKKEVNPVDLIVFENDDYLIINKPAFISTLEDRNDDKNILSLFREIYPGITVCHRLDKETSGALVLAKHEDAYKSVALQFEDRKVDKVYHAFVRGRFMDETVQVDMPLRVAGSGRVKIDRKKGKEATTLFRPKKYFQNYTIVEAKPVTGRRHQIRVHLGYLEYPICGDEYYGGEPIFLSHFKKKYKLSEGKAENPLFSRVALHAHSIEFLGLDDTKIVVTCDYPKDMQMILGKLEKYN